MCLETQDTCFVWSVESNAAMYAAIAVGPEPQQMFEFFGNIVSQDMQYGEQVYRHRVLL